MEKECYEKEVQPYWKRTINRYYIYIYITTTKLIKMILMRKYIYEKLILNKIINFDVCFNQNNINFVLI